VARDIETREPAKQDKVLEDTEKSLAIIMTSNYFKASTLREEHEKYLL